MLKKLLLTLLCANLCATDNSQDGLSTTQKVLIGGALGTTAVAAAVFVGPVVLSASTIAAIKAAAAAATAKAAAAGVAIKTAAVTAAPVVGQISTGLFVARQAKPYVFHTAEEALECRKQQEANEGIKAKEAFSSCLIKNRLSQRDTSRLPSACEEMAFMFALLEGQTAVDKLIRDVNN